MPECDCDCAKPIVEMKEFGATLDADDDDFIHLFEHFMATRSVSFLLRLRNSYSSVTLFFVSIRAHAYTTKYFKLLFLG